MVEPTKPISSGQTAIDMKMQEVKKMVQVKMTKIDKWMDHQTVIHFAHIKPLKKLESLTKLENQILDWTEKNLIFEELEIRIFCL